MVETELIVVVIFIGIVGFVVYKLLAKNRPQIRFNQLAFHEKILKDLDNKINQTGTKIKNGKLVIGYQVNKIHKYCEFSGSEDEYEFDEDRNVFLKKEGEKKQKYFFILFQSKSNNFFFSLLGIKNKYYLINQDKIKIKFDEKTNTWKLPKFIDYHSYGNVFIADDDSKEYLRKLGVAFYDESLQTHLMNNPNRIVAQDLEHAKRVNLIKEGIETEMKKYDQGKRASETMVT